MSDTPRFSSFSTGHHMSSQLSGWALPSEPEMLNRPYKPPVVASTFEVEGEVLEVLEKLGLAHIKTGSGEVYGINLKTPGIIFSDLHEGQKVRCTVTHKFHRVLSAALLV